MNGALQGRDIICFANDWKGDPLSKKQIMVRLARHNRILWVNSLHNRKPQLARKDFRRAYQKVSESFRGVQPVHQNIWQFTPLYLPVLGSAWIRKVNVSVLRLQLRLALSRLGFRNPISWTYAPSSADLVGTLGEALVVYHCVDEFGAFSDAAPEIRQREQELLEKSNLVIVSSGDLLAKKRPLNPNVHLVTHGVDYEHFRKATDASTPVAPELKDLPRPILGFHGLIADWVDLKLIAELARVRPQWSIVLVGRGDTSLASLAGLPNIHAIGHRPYETLPQYLRGFDVALLPFVVNELTLASNPLKLREYLAAGLPVVAAPLPEVARFEGLVTLSGDAEGYVRAVEALEDGNRLGPSEERSREVVGESWDAKVREIETLLSALSDARVAGAEGRAPASAIDGQRPHAYVDPSHSHSSPKSGQNPVPRR